MYAQCVDNLLVSVYEFLHAHIDTISIGILHSHVGTMPIVYF